MALLTRMRALGLGCCALLVSCDGSDSLGHADLWLSDCQDRARCDTSQPGEHFAVQAFFDPNVSRYAPHGLYAYVELPRSDGTRGVLELDVPTNAASDAPLSDYQVSYRELANESLRFESRSVRGQIVLPGSLSADDAASCGCDEGVFTLQFTDEHDHVRALSLGHLSRSEKMCLGGLQSSEDDGLRVRTQRCESAPAPSAPATPPPTPSSGPIVVSSSPHYHDQPYVEVDSYTTVDTGCGDSSYDDSGSSGCGGSSSSEESSESGGCGSSNNDEDSKSQSGCEGDTSDQPSSCSVARGPHRGGSPFMGTGLPVSLVLAWHLLRSARKRKR